MRSCGLKLFENKIFENQFFFKACMKLWAMKMGLRGWPCKMKYARGLGVQRAMLVSVVLLMTIIPKVKSALL